MVYDLVGYAVKVLTSVFALWLLYRFGWHLPAFSAMMMLYAIRFWIYNPEALEPTRTSDLILCLAKIAASVEAVSWLFGTTSSRYRRPVWCLLVVFGLLGGTLALGRFGFSSAWQVYESLKLVVHAGLVLFLTSGLWFFNVYGTQTRRYLWGHALLLLGLFAWHLTIRLWPLPPLPAHSAPEAEAVYIQAWTQLQIAFRLGFLLLLWGWLALFGRVVRPTLGRLSRNG